MKISLVDIKNRCRATGVLAITLESERIAVDYVRRNGDEARAVQSLSVPVGSPEILNDPVKAGTALAEALDSAGVRERNCVVCVPPGWALTSSTDLPELGDEDLRGFLELHAEREFSVSAGDLRLGYCAYSLPGNKRRATLAALSAKKVEAVEQMIEVSRRHASSISLALNKCAAQPQPMLHFLTNGNHTDLVITAGGGVAGLRSLPGPLVTGDTAFDPAAFCRDVRITLGRLPDTVRQQIRRAEFAGSSAQNLCQATRLGLMGMGIESPECSQTPVRVGPEPPGAAVESARLQLLHQPVPFEFVVPETKRWQVMLQRFDTSRRRQLLVAAAALVLLPILLLFIRAQMENHLTGEWNAISSQAADLDDLQKEIHEFRPWFKTSPENLQLFEGLVSSFPSQGDVWAKSIQVGKDYQVTCTGFARTQPALMAMMDRLRARHDVSGLQVQQIRGENPIQFSIIYQWEAQNDR